MNRRAFLSVAAVTGAALLAARRSMAGPVTTDEIGDQVQTVPKGHLPDFAGPEKSDIGRLYRYAVDHREELRYIPCTCGCADAGHKSNGDCYVKAVQRDGSLTFTSHAAT
jgi:uncharacterized protein with PCYCGC motif